MNRYEYFKYAGHETVFECEAIELQDADRLFLEATGIDAVKAMHIGARWTTSQPSSAAQTQQQS